MRGFKLMSPSSSSSTAAASSIVCTATSVALVALLMVACLGVECEAKKKKFEGDFEFVDEVSRVM